MMKHLLVGSLLLGLALPAAVAGSRGRATVILSDNPGHRALQEKYGWADAVVVDGTIYVSGVIAVPQVGDKGLEPAFTRAFERLGATLKRAGARWEDVVEVRSYHTDPIAQFDAIAAVKLRYIKPPHPAWTAVGTSGLLDKRGLAEISLVARLSPARSK